MVAAVRAVEDAEGAVGALVNNAGIQEIGAIETVPMERVRALFETNVFGPVRLAQLVLPGMREQGGGRIVTVGSMNGRFTWPGTGFYCATKHALEAISDALRHEARPFGVDTVLIEPGFVKTPLGETAANRRVGGRRRAVRELQRRRRGRRADLHDRDAGQARLHAGGGRRDGRKGARGRPPRARYRVAPSAGVFMTTRKLLPDVAFDALLRSQMPSPTRGG